LTKWLPIVVGIAALMAVFLIARFLSESGNVLKPSEQPSTQLIESVIDPAPETAASRLEQTPSANGNESSSSRHEAADTKAVQSVTRYQGTESGEPAEPEIVGRVSGKRGIDMPGLLVWPGVADGAGTGPSKDDFGLPGPEVGARNVVDAGPLMRVTESDPESVAPQTDIDFLDSGPSQTNLGLPGPGEEQQTIAESSVPDAGQTDERDEGQPLPTE